MRGGGRPLLPLTALRERVAEALNISLRTVSRVSQVCKSGNPLQCPEKTKKREKPVTDVGDFDQSAIRNVIYEMIQNKKYVTQKTLLQLLRERDIFHGSITSLNVILKNIGFKYKKVYAADQMALEHGHVVLRLPPYHCILNPIENIWAIAKQYYNKQVGQEGYGREKCLEMWKRAIESVTPEMWENTVTKTNKIILEWWHREVGFDQEDIAPLILNLEDDFEDSDDFEEIDDLTL